MNAGRITEAPTARLAEMPQIENHTFFNVTRERVRQIETKALNKLRYPNRRKKLIEFIE